MNQIRVLSTGQTYKIEAGEQLNSGQEVLVEAEQILEPSVVLCVCPKKNIDSLPETKFIRIMTPEDRTHRNELKEKARQSIDEAQTKVLRHGLDMKISDADLSFDEKKMTFYFSSNGRVDFRALVSDMVGSFRKIIRLQQIGPREETRLMGGYGVCGQELCCKRFIKDLDGVSAKMAVIQETGGSKLSKMTGCCGRLMCCLSYEADEDKGLIKKEIKK
ncbi:MAG: regulatory iron-sulfur-containing complex subunit RicT [Candidatus Berkelbacteria bacterium]